jgi:cytoskeleton protein RodZ
VTPLVGLGSALVLAVAIWWVLAGSHSRADKANGPAPTSASVPAPAQASPSAAPAVVVASAPAAPAKNSSPAAANTSPGAGTDGAQPRRDDTAPVRATRLRLELSNDSWVEVYDSRGERLFYDVASAGSVQSVEGRAPLRVVLGHAAGVSIEVDGKAHTIPDNATDGEGARFVVNRSGSLARAR